MGDFTPQIFLNAWTASTLVWSFLQLIYHVLNRNFQKVACYLLQLVISWSSCQNMVDKISISISSNEGYKRSDLLQNCCWPPNHSVTSTICRIFLKPLEIFSVLRNIIKCLALFVIKISESADHIAVLTFLKQCLQSCYLSLCALHVHSVHVQTTHFSELTNALLVCFDFAECYEKVFDKQN